MRHAGVTLDFYDDKGALIKERFPKAADLPDVIKTANVKPAESLPNEAFALVAIDEGQMVRKFACHDPGTTAMSVMYFMEHSDKLPEDAQKMAAARLHNACLIFGLQPPDALSKVAMSSVLKGTLVGGLSGAGIEAMKKEEKLRSASSTEKTAANALVDLGSPTGAMEQIQERRAAEQAVNELLSSPEAVNVTGQKPKAKFASAPIYNEDYAIITADGKRMYPIHDWDHVKLACDYWALESRRMEPEMRRDYAVKVAARAYDLGYKIDDETLLDAGAIDYAEPGHIKTALDMRKVAFPGDENKMHREFLDDLYEKRAEMDPDVFAECIRRFDVMHGLDKGWDHVIISPWESTFGLQKTAAVVWEQGADRVTDEELFNLATNHGGGLTRKYTEHFVKGFENDPIGVFESLPLPQKRVMARLAADLANQGRSMMSSYNEEDPRKTVKNRPSTWLAKE